MGKSVLYKMEAFTISQLNSKWDGRTVVEIPNAGQGEYIDIQIADAGWFFNRNPPSSVDLTAGIFVQDGFTSEKIAFAKLAGKENDSKYDILADMIDNNRFRTNNILVSKFTVSKDSHYYLKCLLETKNNMMKNVNSTVPSSRCQACREE